MGHSSIRIKVRRRKVAQLAAYSRKYTVSNCTIPKPTENWQIIPFSSNIQREFKSRYPSIRSGGGIAYRVDGKGNTIFKDDSWTIPKEGYPQPKNLRKKYKKKYYCKGSNSLRKIVSHPSDYAEFKNFPYMFRPKGRAWFMEQMVQHKLAKWEKKNPCPVKTDKNSPDMFEEEFVVPWKASRELALERIRDFVVSIYDKSSLNKLPLIGRFQQSEHEYVEETVAEIKDVNGEGDRINELNPKTSRLLKIAQKKTNEIKAKRSNLVCTNLKDHSRRKGRIILPKAA